MKKTEKEEELEEEENEISLDEFTPFERFISTIDVILNETNDLTEEEIKGIFPKIKINFEELYTSELIDGLLYICESEIRYMINEDEYMRDIFYGIDLNEIGTLCYSFDDLTSKDCRLLYLIYLWMLVQFPGADLETFSFVEPRIEFTNNGKILVDLIKEEIERRRALEREKISSWRKKHKGRAKRLKKRS